MPFSASNQIKDKTRDLQPSFRTVARHLKKDSERILDEWWEAIKRESPSFAELEKLRNPVLYHEQSLELIVKALEAASREEQDTLLDQVTRMAREMAGERLRQGFLLKDILLSLAVFRSAVLESVGRMLSHRLWVAFPVNVLQMEKRVNEAMDIQVAAVAEAYMNARDAIIRHREEMLRFHNYQLVKLNDLAARMGESLIMAQVMNAAAEALCEMAELSAAAVAINNVQGKFPKVHPDYGHRGSTSSILEWLNSAFFQDLSEEITTETRPLIVVNVAEDPRFAHAVSFGVSSLLIIPLKTAETAVGILYGMDYISRDFTTHEINLILTFANQAALAIENARLYTQAQVAYEELQELDKVKDEFVSVASHEIRTPLALIKGYSSTLLRPELRLSLEKQQRFISGIDEASNRLINLIDNLLSVSRIESGRFKINPQPVNIKEAIQHAVSSFQGQLGNHQLELALPEEELRARCNRDQFEQVMINLISNALKYSPNGGKITVSTARREGPTDDKGRIEVRVSDQGSGIGSEHLPRIFDKFYRAETGLTRKTQGTGLGLYICKSIVTSYGGEIWAESKSGEGSTFIFTLSFWRVDSD
ncbi:MAG: GAF domain-containing protein [Chloroflexi bacterium]|nr:GAF domain-containing protein [Chloroflexota bacterium]